VTAPEAEAVSLLEAKVGQLSQKLQLLQKEKDHFEQLSQEQV
jgi:hypothetical protein